MVWTWPTASTPASTTSSSNPHQALPASSDVGSFCVFSFCKQ